MAKARSVIDVVLGEAVSGTPQERYDDMVAIASVIANRARALGVTPEQVVSAPGEFSAYNKALPAGVESLRDLANDALNAVTIGGPVHNATFYATPNSTKNLPQGLTKATATKGHVYYSDPKNRAIQTSVGYKTPSLAASAVGGLGSFGAQSGPAGYAFGVAPHSAKTTQVSPSVGGLAGLGSTAPIDKRGLGMAALAPNGLIEKYGPNRPNRPNEGIIGIADKAVKDVLGSDWSAVATSGMENPGTDYSGAGRHPTGNALDAYAVNTKTGEVANHAQMAKVSQQSAALGATGVGFGAGYMDRDGISKMHIDTARPNNPSSWGALGTRHTMNADERAGIMGGMMLGTPGFNPDRETGGVPVPADNPNKMSAPVGRVDRAPLADVQGPVETAAAPALSEASVYDGFQRPAVDTRQNFPGMSVPDDVASPNTMAKGLGGIAGYVADNPTGLQAESLAPDRQMPGGPVAPEPQGLSSLAGLQAMQDQREYERPGLSNLLSPEAMTPAPALNAPKTVENRPVAATTTIAAPGAAPTEGTIQAPDEPDESMFGPKTKRALAGLALAGPIGGLLGLASGALSGTGLGFGGPAGMASAGERFGAGTGLQGMSQGMYGPRGATGYSLSNPGAYSVSRGPNQGYDLTNQYGARTTYGPSGDVRANSDTVAAWGNVLGGLFGGESKKSKDKDGGKGKGLGGTGYSGKGLY